MSSDSPRPPYSSGMVRPNRPISRMPVDDVGRVLVGVLERLGVRDDLLVDELPDRGQDLLLDVGESGGLGETGHVLVSLLDDAVR